jgi:thiamine pyrophosphokinase
MASVLTAIVLTGGDPVSPDIHRVLPKSGLVIAADSGLAHAETLGLAVDLVVGDFDSVDPEALARAEARGATLQRHSPDKDHTDLELALIAAIDGGAGRIVVIGGAGGRLDHLLANALVLASPSFAGAAIEAYIGPARLAIGRPSRAIELRGPVGALCSLLALGGPVTGVRTHGLRFRLDDETLVPGSTRGVSNELLASSAVVSIESGTLLAIQPHDAVQAHDRSQ